MLQRLGRYVPEGADKDIPHLVEAVVWSRSVCHVAVMNSSILVH
jgi:hypothetical protein